MLQIQGARTITLGPFTTQETVFLFSIDITDQAFFRFEVKGHRIVLIGVRTHFKNRCSRKNSSCISNTCGMNDTVVKTHIDFFALQVHIGVLHLSLSIEMGSLGSGIINK